MHGIPFEMFRGDRMDDDLGPRQLVSVLDDVLLRVFNLVLSSGKYPDAWRLAMLEPLLKSLELDKLNLNNYRGIALLSSMSKLFANILERRLTDFQWVTGAISKEQFGFTKGRRTLDPTFILDTLVEAARADSKKVICCLHRFSESL